jgi:UDPglucose--hexose-1-phosphate uridylyltransferase
VRVVPNKYPALVGRDGRSEVVVHTPRHVTSIANMTAAELGDVAEAWQARAGAARAEGFTYVHALINEGPSAGGSLPHTHSQLVWLALEPPVVAEERRSGQVLADLLRNERAEGDRILFESGGLLALCPWGGRGPYELLIAPLDPEIDAFASPRLPKALELLSAATRRIHALEGRIPLNAWLHTPPFGASDGHWHLELLPRLTIAAGLELGAGVYVNPLPPERAAEALRRA